MRTSWYPVISSCMASQKPPPEKRCGGAAATAISTATNLALTGTGQESRKSLPGMASVGSSSTCLLKYAMSYASVAAGAVFRRPGAW